MVFPARRRVCQAPLAGQVSVGPADGCGGPGEPTGGHKGPGRHHTAAQGPPPRPSAGAQREGCVCLPRTVPISGLIMGGGTQRAAPSHCPLATDLISGRTPRAASMATARPSVLFVFMSRHCGRGCGLKRRGSSLVRVGWKSECRRWSVSRR